MAKFNIVVELDWIEEGGEIDEVIKDEIINSIIEKISSKINEEIAARAEEKISQNIDEQICSKVNEITTNLLKGKFDMTDKWGDVIEKDTSVLAQLKKRLDNFLEEEVDKNGQPSRYGDKQKRLDYIINQNINYSLQNKIEEAAREIRKALEEYIDKTLKAQIGENVAQLIGLNQITSKLSK